MIFARSWKTFERTQAIGLLSLYKKCYWFKPKFYLNINGKVEQEWLDFIYYFVPPEDIILYSDNFFKKYAKIKNVSEKTIDNFDNWKWIYHILLYYYLYNEKGITYLTTYDDDILFNQSKIDEALGCMNTETPFAIGELTIWCDKSVFGKICTYFQHKHDINYMYWSCSHSHLGLNSGFMGFNNSIFREYSSLEDVCNFFTFKPYTHFEPTDDKALNFQNLFNGLLLEQSFLGVNNKAFSSRKHITLTSEEGYIIDYDRIDENYKNISKIEHYIGMKKYKNFYFDRLDEEYERLKVLKQNNLGIEHFY